MDVGLSAMSAVVLVVLDRHSLKIMSLSVLVLGSKNSFHFDGQVVSARRGWTSQEADSNLRGGRAEKIHGVFQG